eukprot:CAMPEP_0175765614 /NCGR_PEP_ID=MMETSP0097-20121207/68900_1 /TAXON_ID=311494 /ORGANISM="Alexandrium monilatum, Strain CCMP3105" /LENGTH=38 /DNA_ID= /DNA_START= /DNA_END= /DNA_ORIENTATION=
MAAIPLASRSQEATRLISRPARRARVYSQPHRGGEQRP